MEVAVLHEFYAKLKTTCIITDVNAKTKKPDNKDSFESVAEKLECDTSDDALDKVFESIDLKVEKEEDSTD